MKTEIRKPSDKLVTYQITPEDRAAVYEVAAQLGFSKSAVMRRAMRIGLKVLRNVEVPGTHAGESSRADR